MKSKQKFICLAVFAVFILVIFLIPSQTHAQLIGIGSIASKAINFVATGIGYLLTLIGNILFGFAGMLVKFALDLNATIAQQGDDLAHTGWTIVRDIANLGFVLVIIVIAVATILRREEYGVKKFLPKLIAAAILVNFSFVIAGTFIDFANVLTNFFFARMGGDSFHIVSNIAGPFNPQKLSGTPQIEGVTSLENATPVENLANAALNLGFIATFTFIGAFSLLAIAAMLLLRYLYLNFLLIIVPIVWLFWVIPGLSGQFSKWWSKFFEWVFFAPASMFFIYLAVLSATNLQINPGGDFGTGGATAILKQGGQMIVLCGLLVGSLIIAQNMGVAGAAGAMGLLGKAGGAVRSWLTTPSDKTKRGWERTRAAALSSAPVQGAAELMKRLPGFKRAGFALGAQGRVARQGIIDDASKRISKYNDKDLAENLNTLSRPERIAAMERLAKNGTLSMLTPDVASHITTANKELFEDYGHGREWTKNVEAGAGMDVKSAELINAFKEKVKRGGEIIVGPDLAKLTEAMSKWTSTLTDAQARSLPAKNTYNGKEIADGFQSAEASDIYRTALLTSMAKTKPEAISSLYVPLTGKGQAQLIELSMRLEGNLRGREGEDNVAAVNVLETAKKNIASAKLFGAIFEQLKGKDETVAAPPTTTAPK